MTRVVIKSWLLGILACLALVVVPSGAAVAQNITDTEFKNTWENPDRYFTSAKLEVLRQHKVLFVPGFFGNRIVDAGRFFGGRFRIGEYFDEQIAFLRNLGVEAAKVHVNSEAHPEVNSPFIEEAILKSTKPVILITHSKGSVDALQAFFENPELNKHVPAWIPVQAPFYGTPVADFFFDNRFFNPIAIYILEMLGGTSEVVSSLTQSVRSRWLVEHKTNIDALAKDTAIVNFTSWKARELNPFDTPLAFTRNAMDKMGIQNDGLVPWRSGLLPGYPYVVTTNTDHIVPVMYSHLYMSYDRIRLIKTLMILVTNRIPTKMK